MSKTQDLRDECKRRGIEYTCGLLFDGRRVNKENVTTLWDGEHPEKSITFEEDEHGCLWCADELSVAECIGAYLAGLERDDG
jgi:hypothetical protein